MDDDTRAPVSVCLLGTGGGWAPSMSRMTAALAGLADAEVDTWIPAEHGPGERRRSRASSWSDRWLARPRRVHRLRADVFHVTDHSHAHLLNRAQRSRGVITCHDLLLLRATRCDLGFRPDRRAVAQFRLTASRMRRARALVAVSESTRQDMHDLLGIAPDRVEVIPNGISDAFRPLPAAQRASTRSQLGVGTATLLVQVGVSVYKNPSTSVRTLAGLRRAGVDARLAVVGLPVPDDVPALARRLGVEAYVHALGRIADDQLCRLYNAADVLVFPSTWEGFGLPPLEAMACGLPVVASDIAPLRETSRDAAVYVDPWSVDGWVSAVGDLCGDEQARAAARERGHRVVGRYTWSSVLRDYSAVYRRTAGR